MKALITGASSGIGADMARILDEKGYDLILVARSKDKLERLKKELKGNVSIIAMDISSSFNCMKLYNKLNEENIDVLINNAGFGLYGEFNSANLDKELDMIDLNIKSLHILTKLFLKDFINKNHGYILNVASSAVFLPGPLMATYYATKAYVFKLTLSINEELKQKKSKVYIGTLCPGPVNTNFNNVAGVKKSINQLESYDVAKYGINKMFKKRVIIVPGLSIKIGSFMTRFLPYKAQSKISYNIQQKK
ncbi:MAG: SDR family oxidoreductase [Bacilli bacterium]|nr:SDR family oxidoreductase [Bacilli bacterium]